MKKYTILFLLTLFFASAFGQCDNGVSTNPTNPTNNNLPINPNNYGDKFLNQFDWNKETINGTLAPYVLDHMQYNQTMQNVMSEEADPYYNYIAYGEKLSHQHGWELMLLNVGTYPNLEDFSLPDGFTDIPYIVFYNRYTGIVRVFANYGSGYLPTGVNFDAVRVELTYNDVSNMNGLMRLNQGHDVALDQTSKVTSVSGIAKHPNSPGMWFSTDLQVAYDPCICYHPSNMRLNFSFTVGESIVLQGRQIAVEDDLVTGYFVNESDFLTNFDYSLLDDPDKGSIIMYKTMDAMVNDYIAKLEKYKTELAAVQEHNAEVERNLAIIKMFKHTVLQGGSAAIDAVANLPWFQDAVDWANDFIGKDSLIRKKDLVKEAKKGMAAGVETFITKNFQSKSLPTSPNRPSVTFSEMVIQGAMSDTLGINGPNFFTPGTYGSEGTPAQNITSYFRYPIYNDALGLFALLETPKILVSKTIKNDSITNDFYQSGGSANFFEYHSWTKGYQFKLKNDLKYKLNSNLDIKSHEIKSGLVIKAKKKRISQNGTNFHYDPTLFLAYIDHNYTANFNSNMLDFSNYEPIHSRFIYQNGANFLGSDYTQQYYLQGDNGGQTRSKDEIVFTTEFLPIDAFYNLVSGFALKNEYFNRGFLDQYIPYNAANEGYDFEYDIELKLIVDIEFETLREDGTPNSATLFLTYKIPNDTSHIKLVSQDIYPNLTGSIGDISQYPENLTFVSKTFDGAAVQGCKLDGSVYTCQAWNNITLEGDLVANPGYQVNFYAGNEIYEINNSSSTGEIVREIKPILDYSHPMPEMILDSVANFCKGSTNNAQRYKANTRSMSLFDTAENANTQQLDAETARKLDFQLYPNPASLNAYLAVNSFENQAVFIEVMDITGKVQEVNIEQVQKDLYNLQISGLAKGIYFVKLTSLHETKTKQLIVN